LRRNKKFFAEFEERYEAEAPAPGKKADAKKASDRQKLDPQILDTVEDGVRQLKDKILYEYVEQTSTLTMLILIGLFAGLAYTLFKVNKLVNKAHMF